MIRSISVRDFRRKMADALNRVAYRGEHIALTRHGEVVAVLVSYKDLQELINKHKVNVLRTPQSVFKAQLEAWDVLTKRLSDADPFFAKVVESQRAWAKRVAYYYWMNDADYKLGYEHVFKVKIPS